MTESPQSGRFEVYKFTCTDETSRYVLAKDVQEAAQRASNAAKRLGKTLKDVIKRGADE